MKKKSFGTLTAVTAIVVVAAMFAVHQRSAANASTDEPAHLFPDLEKHVNDVAELDVKSGDGALTIRRDGDDWGVVERAGYHAKFDHVKETLVGLAEMQVLEPKTSHPDRYADLGVEDPAKGNEAKQVTLKDKDGKVLADLIVGQGKTGGEAGLYVRKPGQEQALLCKGALDVSTDPSTWMDKEILRVDSKEISEVRIHHPDGEEVVIHPADASANKFVVANVPKGRKEKYDGVANATATALLGLMLDDVRPASEVDFEKDPVATAEYLEKDGEKITLRLARQDDKTWVQVSSEYDSPAVPPEAAADAPDDAMPAAPAADGAKPGEGGDAAKQDDAKKKADDAKAAAAAAELATRQRVKDHQEHLSPWAFAIPEYKATSIAKKMDDLLAPVDVGPPAEAAGAGGGAAAAPGAPAPAPPAGGTPPATAPDQGTAPAAPASGSGGAAPAPVEQGTGSGNPPPLPATGGGQPAPATPPAPAGSGG